MSDSTKTRSFDWQISNYFILTLIFIVSVSIGSFLWNKIRLPFNNPDEIKGILTLLQHHPANDIVRFIVFLLLPCLALTIVYLFSSRSALAHSLFQAKKDQSQSMFLTERLPFKKIGAGAILFISIGMALNTPTATSMSRYVDTVHEGISLMLADACLRGAAPYKDYVIDHGFYEDPGRSIVAFKLLGRSIGASRTIQSINKIITFLLFSLFLLLLFRWNYLYVFFVQLIFYGFRYYPPNAMPAQAIQLQIAPRDMVTLGFIISWLYLSGQVFRKKNNLSGRSRIAIFLCSFFSIASLIYSIDRGAILFLTNLIAFAMSVIIIFYHARSSVRDFLVCSALGFFCGFFLFGQVIGWNILDFAKYLGVIGSYNFSLTYSYIYHFSKLPYFLACLILSLEVFWLTYRILVECHNMQAQRGAFWSHCLRKYFIEIVLTVLSLFYLRLAFTISDQNHLSYSMWPSWVLGLYLVIKYYIHPRFRNYYRFNAMAKKIYILVFGVVMTLWVGHLAGAVARDPLLIVKNFPYKIPDNVFIEPRYQQVIRYLQNQMNKTDDVFALTAEGAWYYFLDKKPPVKSPSLFLDITKEGQTQLIRELESKKVKYLIHSKSNEIIKWSRFSSPTASPLLIGYIESTYRVDKVFEDIVILVRKT